jgi:hypothetical protein
MGLLSFLAARSAVSGSSSRLDFITTLTGDEVFAHVTHTRQVDSIERQGFRVGAGRLGTGVYLLPPEEVWGGGLPASRTPAASFSLRWHEDQPLTVLRLRLPAGTRLLRVSGPNVALEAHQRLAGGVEAGWTAYRQAMALRPSWEDSDVSRDKVLADLLVKHAVDGIYFHEPVFDQGEILLLDPSKLRVVSREDRGQ